MERFGEPFERFDGCIVRLRRRTRARRESHRGLRDVVVRNRDLDLKRTARAGRTHRRAKRGSPFRAIRSDHETRPRSHVDEIATLHALALRARLAENLTARASRRRLAASSELGGSRVARRLHEMLAALARERARVARELIVSTDERSIKTSHAMWWVIVARRLAHHHADGCRLRKTKSVIEIERFADVAFFSFATARPVRFRSHAAKRIGDRVRDACAEHE